VVLNTIILTPFNVALKNKFWILRMCCYLVVSVELYTQNYFMQFNFDLQEECTDKLKFVYLFILI
jgi:hypothetical protein